MFGRFYNSVGSTNSDFIIKTRGQVKIQYGGTFIDLIKDGKLNNGSSILYTVPSKNEVGSKGEGIYVNTSDGSTYVANTTTSYPLSGDGLYVSYKEQKDIKEEDKDQAQKNIGLVYDTQDQLTGRKTGIVYVTSDKKIYTIQDSVITPLTFDLPNPITTTLTITPSEKVALNITQGAFKLGNATITEDSGLYLDTQAIYTSFKLMANENTLSYPGNVSLGKIRTTGISGQHFSLEDNYSSSTLKVDNLELTNQLYTMDKYKRLNEKDNLYTFTVNAEYDQNNNPTKATITGSLKYLNYFKAGDTVKIQSDYAADGDLIQLQDVVGTVAANKDDTKDSDTTQNRNLNIEVDLTKTSKEALLAFNDGNAHTSLIYSSNIDTLEDLSKGEVDKALPSGIIMSFKGDTAPNGWHLCDGKDNTPNLTSNNLAKGINYIIKVDTQK